MLEPTVKKMNQPKVPENRAFNVTLILLVSLAAFSTAMKDLNNLQEMVSSVQEFTSQWRAADLVMLDVESISTRELCPNDSPPMINSSAESGSCDGIAPVRGTEIERIDCETLTEPEVGGKVQMVAGQKANRNVSSLARAKYAPARNLKQETSKKRRDSHWPANFEYKTFDRAVTLDFPLTKVTDIKDAIENEVPPNFPLSLLGRMNRKQSHGKTDNGRREFMIMIKRFECNSSSRRAS